MISVLLFILILIGFAFYAYQKSSGIRFVKKLNAGWNLGNSLDVNSNGAIQGEAELFEVYWGNPVTTKAIIDEVKASGFHTIRIPVTWYEHMDNNGLIDEKWMDRVQEVVDYVIDNNMYAVINIHHDSWFVPTYENKEKATQLLCSTWSQIAKRFAEYDEHLIFEAMNEPRLIGTEYEWNAGTKEAKEVVNYLNDAFVKTIRSSPSKNKNRYLMIAPYCNSSDKEALEDFVLPKDDRLIISIHEYVPYEFVMKKDGTDTWDKQNPKDTEEIDLVFDNLNQYFIRKGIPVIISEFGAINKNNLKARLDWLEYFAKSARENNIAYIWWDDGGKPSDTGKYILLDRYNLIWKYPEINRILVDN